MRNKSPHTRKDIPNKVIGSYSTRCLFWHEFCEHRSSHREDQHGADAEEEISNQRHEPEDAFLGCPAIPYQRGWVQKGGNPCIFSHPVFGSVHQFPVFVVATRSFRFPGHDGISPPSSEERGEDVADAVGDVGQADDGGGVIVGRIGECGFEGDVEEVQGSECYAGIIDSDENGWEAQVEDDFQRIEEEAFEKFDVCPGPLVDGAASRLCAGEAGTGFCFH